MYDYTYLCITALILSVRYLCIFHLQLIIYYQLFQTTIDVIMVNRIDSIVTLNRFLSLGIMGKRVCNIGGCHCRINRRLSNQNVILAVLFVQITRNSLARTNLFVIQLRFRIGSLRIISTIIST